MRTVASHIATVLLIILAMSTTALAQVPAVIQAYRTETIGSAASRLDGTLNNRSIQTLFSNFGQMPHFPYQPGAVWPRVSHHEYLEAVSFLLGSELTLAGQIHHPVVSGGYAYFSADPITGAPWGWEPLPGYVGPGPKVAVSTDASSFPKSWAGQWDGLEGPGTLHATQEGYYVMDDATYLRYSASPYYYRPVVGDTNRAGLGLRAEVRALVWADSVARDMIFWIYDLVNISDFDLAPLSCGFHLAPTVGGAGNSANSARFDSLNQLVYCWNPSLPAEGLIGVVPLESPRTSSGDTCRVRIAGFATHINSDVSSTGLRLRNEENLWTAMTGGFSDTTAANMGIVAAFGSGVFELPKWTRTRYSAALVFATSYEDLIQKAMLARSIASLNYHLPSSTTGTDIPGILPHQVTLAQNYPNPFNPSTTIRYSLAHKAYVKLAVYDLLGHEVTLLVNGEQETGNREIRFNASHLASGMYIHRLSVSTDGTSGQRTLSHTMLLLR